MVKKRIALLIVLLLFCGCIPNFSRSAENSAESCTIGEELRVRTLAEVWSTAKYDYGYWEQLSDIVDWDAAFEQYLPLVMNAKNDDEYVDLMREFTALLHDGHTHYRPFPGYAANKGSLPIKLEYLDGSLYLVGKNASVDLELGSELLRINEEPALDYILSHYGKYVPVLTEPAHTRETVEQFRNDQIGKSVTLEFQMEDHSVKAIQLEYDKHNHVITDELSTKTDFDTRLYNSNTYTVAPLNEDILYIEIRSFASSGMDDTFTNIILPQLAEYRGCILDVRQNPGGNSYYGDVILQTLSNVGVPPITVFNSTFYSMMVPYGSDNSNYQADDRTKSMAQKMMKHAYYGIDQDCSEYALNQADHWDTLEVPMILSMPVIVLTSDQTGSAADTFAAKAKVMENFTVMGLTTHGATGNNHSEKLPDGSSYSLSVDNVYSPEGYCIWNHGAIPDIEVWQTIEDLKNREDTVLNTAVEVLQETPNTENPENPCSRTVEERVAVLSEIWSTAQYYYGNWIVMPDDFDWDAKYHEFLPRIIQAENDADYVNCLREFVALLQDGHTDFVPASDLQLDSAFLPFSLVDLDGRLILDGSSRNYGIPLGSELIEVKGQPAWDYIEEQFAKYVPVLTEPARQSEMIKQFLKGEKGTGITLKWLTPQAETLEVQSTYEASGMQYFNQLNPSALSDTKLLLSASPYMVYEISEELVYVEISTFTGQSFQLYENQVIPILENYQGVILDVRNNRGGNFTNALTILQSFSNQPVPNGYYFDSEFHSSLVPYGSESDPVFYSGSELNRKAARMMKHQYYGADADIEILLEQQEPEPYPILTTAFMDKPVVVLTSQFTASAAESFAATAKLMDNFTLMGLRTYGISGNNNRVNLSDGSFYSLTVDLCFTPDKQLFWNQGVQPDIEVKMTLEDLLEEKDTVLFAAMETLQRQIQERTAR